MTPLTAERTLHLLYGKVEGISHSAVLRAYERAGARLRTAVQGDAGLREMVRGVPSWQVPPLLGRGTAYSLKLPTAKLLDGFHASTVELLDAALHSGFEVLLTLRAESSDIAHVESMSAVFRQGLPRRIDAFTEVLGETVGAHLFDPVRPCVAVDDIRFFVDDALSPLEAVVSIPA